MATASPTPARRTGPARSGPDDTRRSYVLAALVLAVVILGGVVAVTVTADEGPRQDTQGRLSEDGGARPRTIPRPGEGKAPENPGDRGGWEQLALFGVMLGAMAGIGVVIFRGGRRGRTGRQEWLAMAGAGPSGPSAGPGGPAGTSTVDEDDAGSGAAGGPEPT